MRASAMAVLLVVAGCEPAPPSPPSDAGVGDAEIDASTPDAGRDAGPTGCDVERVSPSVVEEDSEWPCGRWVLDGPVTVRPGVTLTLEPGTTLVAADDDAEVIVERDGRLIAEGTPTRPIVLRGEDGWEGVHLRGAARVNDGACFEDPRPGTPECELPGWRERRDERGVYGGDDDTADCGALRYVRIVGAPLVLAGCGSATLVSHVQVDAAPGDAVTVIGGTVPLGHLLITGAVQDGLHIERGWRGDAQLVAIASRDGQGESAVYAANREDAPTAEPRTDFRLWNLTLRGGGDGRVMWVGHGARAAIRNVVAANFSAPPAFALDETEWPEEVVLEYAVLWDVGAVEDEHEDDAERLRDPERHIRLDLDPRLEGYRPLAALPEGAAPRFGPFTPADFGDRRATFLGAIVPGGEDWTTGIAAP